MDQLIGININQSRNHYLTDEEIQKRYNSRKDHIVLRDLVWLLSFSLTHFDKSQLYVEPLIIPPFLHKNIKMTEGAERVFPILWKKAKEELLRCKRIIIIGYSFPISDFWTKKHSRVFM